jgi:hypothetical protein
MGHGAIKQAIATAVLGTVIAANSKLQLFRGSRLVERH